LDPSEAQQLYTFRERLSGAPSERFLTYRTLVSDAPAIIPGWYWFRELPALRVTGFLVHLSRTDASDTVRARALNLLTRLKYRPRIADETERRQFFEVLLNTDVEDVRIAALQYVGGVGDLADLELVEPLLQDQSATVGEAAAKARFHIFVREDVSRALPLLAGGDRGVDTSALGDRVDQISAAQLIELLRTGGTEGRRFAASELRRRGELAVELAAPLIVDPSLEVKRIAFEVLIEKAAGVTADQIREAFRDQKPPTLLTSLGRSTVDVSTLVYKLLLSYSFERLRDMASWYSLDGIAGYRALALEHFDKCGGQIRRDLADRFESFRTESLEKLRPGLGTASDEVWRLVSDQLLKRDRELSEFTVDLLAAAGLEGLARHGERPDAVIARTYLTTSRDPDIQAAAAKVLRRFGSAEDLAILQPIFMDGYGDHRVVAAEAALAHAQQRATALMLNSDSPALVAIALRSLERADLSEIQDMVIGLLRHSNNSIRVKAISYLVERLSPTQLEAVLDGYLEPPYYYNVVCWLDRVLYAPSPLRELFLTELRESLGYKVISEW